MAASLPVVRDTRLQEGIDVKHAFPCRLPDSGKKLIGRSIDKIGIFSPSRTISRRVDGKAEVRRARIAPPAPIRRRNPEVLPDAFTTAWRAERKPVN